MNRLSLLILSLVVASFAFLNCGRGPVKVTPGEIRAGHKTLVIYSENNRAAMANAFFTLKNTAKAEAGKIYAFRPTNVPAGILGVTKSPSLFIVLSGSSPNDNVELRKKVETFGFLQVFSPLLSVELSPRGLQSDFTSLPYAIFAFEKRTTSFNRYSLEIKDELLTSEEGDLAYEIPSAAINTNLCYTNEFCDGVRIVGLPESGGFFQFGVNGSYLKVLRKISKAEYIFTQQVDFSKNQF